MLHAWANADDEKTIASFQALIISARPQVNLSPTRPKSSCGRRKARPAAHVKRACSKVKLTSISLPSPPTWRSACSSKSLSYSRVSPAACLFKAAKSFFALSSSARIKTKPEKVKKCATNQMWNKHQLCLIHTRFLSFRQFIYVVVQFYFLLFLGILMYDNEFETKENKIWTKDKIEPQHLF